MDPAKKPDSKGKNDHAITKPKYMSTSLSSAKLTSIVYLPMTVIIGSGRLTVSEEFRESPFSCSV